MPLYDWTYTHTCPHTGIITAEFDTQLDINADLSGGELCWTIDDVLVGGKSLSDGDRVCRAHYDDAVERADDEMNAGGNLMDQVLEREGIVYRGLGGNDPDGHFRRAAA